MYKDTIAVFDFDGTLTTKDTFIEFARYTVGNKGLMLAIAKNIHWLLAWKLKLTDGGKAKQHLFSSLFKGMSVTEFKAYCRDFTRVIERLERDDTVKRLHSHLQDHHNVYIVSASISDWIVPWALAHGIPEGNVLGTDIEIDRSGHLTGNFRTPNCKGKEKVIRLREKVPYLSEFELYAYGDSSGDNEILALADHPEKIK